MANPVCIVLAFTLASTRVLASVLPPAPMEGLLPNGNFEDPPKATDIKKTVPLHKNALSKWEITGLVEYIHGRPHPGGMYFPVAHGVHAVRLGNEATISQTIPIKSGSLYAVTFGASRTCAQQEVLRVSVSPQSGDLPLQTLYSSGGGDVYAYGFKANSNSKFSLDAEVELKRGRTKLRQIGKQIEGVMRSAYNIEREAGGLKDIPKELPNRDASRFRSQVSQLASEAKKERRNLSKEVKKISNYGISV